jgi:hypothetical protein
LPLSEVLEHLWPTTRPTFNYCASFLVLVTGYVGYGDHQLIYPGFNRYLG